MSLSSAQSCLLSAAFALVVTVAESGTVRAQAQSPGSETTPGWRVKFEGSGSSPVIVDGVLYVASTTFAGDTGSCWPMTTGFARRRPTFSIFVTV